MTANRRAFFRWLDFAKNIPVEAKKSMVTKDMSQLAQYMCTLGSKGEYLAKPHSCVCI